MSQYRPSLRRILALDSKFSKESMLVSGIEELVDIFDEMLEGDDIWIQSSLLS
ncbi:hypothetical protein RhiirA4_486753 [Rhizophagus irregularis]|uniref:Uncharacterized protein n=1 Tax=Rhizophagus irregularis TaxID=588596 RepID=A0A2I1HRQ8_9GLOM|nr:hypothetical protein RhiirA4_486753 [Rhizophagus irregularis]